MFRGLFSTPKKPREAAKTDQENASAVASVPMVQGLGTSAGTPMMNGGTNHPSIGLDRPNTSDHSQDSQQQLRDRGQSRVSFGPNTTTELPPRHSPWQPQSTGQLHFSPGIAGRAGQQRQRKARRPKYRPSSQTLNRHMPPSGNQFYSSSSSSTTAAAAASGSGVINVEQIRRNLIPNSELLPPRSHTQVHSLGQVQVLRAGTSLNEGHSRLLENYERKKRKAILASGTGSKEEDNSEVNGGRSSGEPRSKRVKFDMVSGETGEDSINYTLQMSGRNMGKEVREMDLEELHVCSLKDAEDLRKGVDFSLIDTTKSALPPFMVPKATDGERDGNAALIVVVSNEEKERQAAKEKEGKAEQAANIQMADNTEDQDQPKAPREDGEWTCPKCKKKNSGSLAYCENWTGNEQCKYTKVEIVKTRSDWGSSIIWKKNKPGWKCPVCVSHVVGVDTPACRACGAKRPDNPTFVNHSAPAAPSTADSAVSAMPSAADTAPAPVSTATPAAAFAAATQPTSGTPAPAPSSSVPGTIGPTGFSFAPTNGGSKNGSSDAKAQTFSFVNATNSNSAATSEPVPTGAAAFSFKGPGLASTSASKKADEQVPMSHVDKDTQGSTPSAGLVPPGPGPVNGFAFSTKGGAVPMNGNAPAQTGMFAGAPAAQPGGGDSGSNRKKRRSDVGASANEGPSLPPAASAQPEQPAAKNADASNFVFNGASSRSSNNNKKNQSLSENPAGPALAPTLGASTMPAPAPAAGALGATPASEKPAAATPLFGGTSAANTGGKSTTVPPPPVFGGALAPEKAGEKPAFGVSSTSAGAGEKPPTGALLFGTPSSSETTGEKPSAAPFAFGSSAGVGEKPPAAAAPMFGASGSSANTGEKPPAPPIFGGSTGEKPPSATPLFGSLGSSVNAGVNAKTPSASTGASFGQPGFGGTPATAPNGDKPSFQFGSTPAPAQTGFGGSNATPKPDAATNKHSVPPFGQPGFGGTPAAPPNFGQNPPQASTFAAPTPAPIPFGGAPPAAAPAPGFQGGFSFGSNPSSASQSGFGANNQGASATQTTQFGAPTPTTTAPPAFGSAQAPAPFGGNGMGQPPATAGFAAAAPSTGFGGRPDAPAAPSTGFAGQPSAAAAGGAFSMGTGGVQRRRKIKAKRPK